MKRTFFLLAVLLFVLCIPAVRAQKRGISNKYGEGVLSFETGNGEIAVRVSGNLWKGNGLYVESINGGVSFAIRQKLSCPFE